MTTTSISQTAAPFFFDPRKLYLTSAEQKILETFTSPLQELIQARLLGSGVEPPPSAESARLIIKIYDHCRNSSIETKEQFFLALLNSTHDDLLPHLNKLQQVCNSHGEGAFFSCITTKKLHYYSAQTLLHIIDDFHQVALSAGVDFGSLPDFPSYDERGEELLGKLKEDPALSCAAFLDKTAGVPSSFEVHTSAAPKLEELLFRECSFSQLYTSTIHYLASLSEKNRSSMEVYLHMLRFLSGDSTSEVVKIILIKLLVLSSTREVVGAPFVQMYTVEDFKEMVEEVKLVHENWGEEVLLSLCENRGFINCISLGEVSHILKLLNFLSEDPAAQNQAFLLFAQFSEKALTCPQLTEALENLWTESRAELPPQQDDTSLLIERFAGKDPHVEFPLPKEHLQKIEKQYCVVEQMCQEWKNLNFRELIKLAGEIRAKAREKPLESDDVLRLVAIGRLALHIKFHKYPYSTQVLAVLGQLCYKNGSFAQVKTGEGKSLIINLLAFVLAMQNKSIHIISSSRNLSVRDQQTAFEFFKAFGVGSSHICDDQAEAARFQAQKLYGAASDFEFAVLREKLYFIHLFQQEDVPAGEKRFDCVIVDELDNLTIDTATNSTHLGFPASITYDWVYVPLFQFVKEGFSKEDREKLSSSDSLSNLRSFLQEYSRGKYRAKALNLTDDKLQTWLQSAHRALFVLEERQDYVVATKKTSSGEKRAGILIVDAENTGRIMHQSRWSGGVHELVEVKHDIIPEQESLTPISLSHAVFYQLYSSLYGFTGTLGSQSEREEIKEIYGADSFDVPTYRPSARKDSPPTLFPTQEAHLSAILQKVKSCRREQRPILVLCKTIKDSERVEALLKSHSVPFEMLNEMQAKSEEEVLALAGRHGAVTIATNTAGRGTDIVLDEISLVSGGLDVLLTFFPESARVEDQGRGRAGRQGQPGTSEIFLCAEDLDLPAAPSAQNTSQIIEGLNSQRAARARTMKHYHVCRADVERFAFGYVKKFFSLLSQYDKTLQNSFVFSRLSDILSQRKLLLPRTPLPSLQPQDRQLAEEALELLSNKGVEHVKWQVLLKQAAEHSKTNMLNHWALKFNHEVADLLNASNMQILAAQQEGLRRLAQSLFSGIDEALAAQLVIHLEQPLVEAQVVALEELKKQIEVLYNKHKTVWKKYLDPSGSGIAQYLRDITGARLQDV